MANRLQSSAMSREGGYSEETKEALVVEQSYVTNNNAERERLRATIARLNDADLSKSIGHGWTVAVTLAHLAFWDRLVLEWLEDWEQRGFRTAEALYEWDQGVLLPSRDAWRTRNDEMLSVWLAMPTREAAREAITVAETLDQKIETLDPDLVEAILSSSLWGFNQRRLLDRSLHRREHLDEIDRALAG